MTCPGWSSTSGHSINSEDATREHRLTRWEREPPNALTRRSCVVPKDEAGSSVAVIPAGAPSTLRATLPANPPVRLMLIVEARTPPPWVRVNVAGAAERL
jgi:hypothetical protein